MPTISRAAFLCKLHTVAPALVPFVRMWCGQQSTYFLWDATGQRRTIRQGEGCEQGDALARALYALGQHDALLVSTPPSPHARSCALIQLFFVFSCSGDSAFHCLLMLPPAKNVRVA